MKTTSNTEFNGQCAFAVSLGTKDVPSNEKYNIVKDGKKYSFSNPVAKFLWKVIPRSEQKAKLNWSSK